MRAALGAWMISRVYPLGGQTATDEIFWRCCAGDPRVKAQSPAQLGIPLKLDTGGTGLIFSRVGWEDDDTMAGFGLSEYMYRATAEGNVWLFAKRRAIVADRTPIASHLYGGRGRVCAAGVQYTGPTTNKLKQWSLLNPKSGDDTVPITKTTTLTRQTDGKYRADLAPLYASTVDYYTREWGFDPATSTMTVTDVCKPKANYRPIAGWGTPGLPVVDSTACTVKLTNERATATMAFDAWPAEVAVRGGEGDLALEDYDRTLYVANIEDFKSSTRDEQLMLGGYYQIYVVANQDSEGVYRCTTTITVD